MRLRIGSDAWRSGRGLRRQHGDSNALRHAPATIVGTYAYVNPVIAVVLGWLLLREPIHARTFVAMSMILVGVVWIQFSHKLRRSGGAHELSAGLADATPPGDPEPEAST